MRSHSVASPVPASTEPPGGMRPPRAARSSTTTPVASIAASAPGPLGVTAPNRAEYRISSLASVQVKSCFGRSVGRSPPEPPQPRIRPGSRLTPSSARRSPPDAVTVRRSESADTNAPSPDGSGSTRLVRLSTASETSSPPRSELPARSPSVPFAAPITK